MQSWPPGSLYFYIFLVGDPEVNLRLVTGWHPGSKDFVSFSRLPTKNLFQVAYTPPKKNSDEYTKRWWAGWKMYPNGFKWMASLLGYRFVQCQGVTLLFLKWFLASSGDENKNEKTRVFSKGHLSKLPTKSSCLLVLIDVIYSDKFSEL